MERSYLTCKSMGRISSRGVDLISTSQLAHALALKAKYDASITHRVQFIVLIYTPFRDMDRFSRYPNIQSKLWTRYDNGNFGSVPNRVYIFSLLSTGFSHIVPGEDTKGKEGQRHLTTVPWNGMSELLYSSFALSSTSSDTTSTMWYKRRLMRVTRRRQTINNIGRQESSLQITYVLAPTHVIYAS